MARQFKGKTALVTGGNKGIGFAIGKGLSELGFEVIIAARSQKKANAAAKKIEKKSDRSLRTLELDVTDDKSIRNAAHTLERKIKHLDVLVNNAGIYPDTDADILTVSRDLLNLATNTNAFGAIAVTQAFLPLLHAAPSPCVINISSGYGALDDLSASVPSYSLSKLALNGATVMLADALRPQGIAVYAMCPGWVRTDMGGADALLSPEQGADTAIWLATEASPELSGKFFRDRRVISY
ncbi:MAG: SDR family NAD(P)-dependent oxidoreductase [Cyanobacteriota bacterium]|nr:SDR family NAD(P)-dependent oxidoreductase [Cyanobacteriota bacterium]